MDERSALPAADLPQKTGAVDERRDTVNADLIKSLQTIAAIESIDPDGMRYTWRELAVESAMIAREALAYHEIQTGSFEMLSAGRPSGDDVFSKSGANPVVEALHEITNIEFLDPGQYSWKDRAVMAGTIAREALIHAGLQYDAGQGESLSSQIADRYKSAPDGLSLPDILSDGRSDSRGLDPGYEENDLGHSFSF